MLAINLLPCAFCQFIISQMLVENFLLCLLYVYGGCNVFFEHLNLQLFTSSVQNITWDDVS